MERKFNNYLERMEKQTVDKFKKKIKLMIMMGSKYSLEVIFNDYFFNIYQNTIYNEFFIE